MRKKVNFTKEMLEDLYVNQKLSIEKIAKKLGVVYSTIWRRMEEFDIKRRTNSESQKGIRKSNKARLGKHHTEETKQKMSEACKGKKNHNYGKPMSEEQKIKISNACKGEKHPCWKGGITPENKKIRRSREICLWRKAVLERDNFTCQMCGKHGGKLHVHHINNFSEFPELRCAIDNGIVLCKKCHKEFHHLYGNKNNTKEQLENFIKWKEKKKN